MARASTDEEVWRPHSTAHGARERGTSELGGGMAAGGRSRNHAVVEVGVGCAGQATSGLRSFAKIRSDEGELRIRAGASANISCRPPNATMDASCCASARTVHCVDNGLNPQRPASLRASHNCHFG